MSRIFFKGLVVDVINSTSDTAITNNSLDENRSNVTAEAMKNFPRNTAIVKNISEGMGKKSGSQLVCYPFFSSHICMPLKPGEYVWFVYENPENQGSVAYWLSRVSEPNHVEDVNYTFSSRTFTQQATKTAPTASDKFDGVTVDEGEIQTFSWQSPTSDPQELIDLIGIAEQVHRFEPVPRYTKRPGDLVLQGSNNSLIMLGEERGHWSSDSGIIASANDSEVVPGQPAIDIVVGRGAKKVGGYQATSGKTIKNEFGIDEIDKREKPITEGDAHFHVDASRIYLTSNSSNVYADHHPDNLLQIDLPETSKRKTPTSNEPGSFCVVKSDNLRLVSRNFGSIRVVKEPSGGKNDGSAIMMYNDGQVQVAAKQIILSRYNTDGTPEPYLKQSAMVSFLTGLVNDLFELSSKLVVAAGSLASSANAGGPVLGAQAAAGNLLSAAVTMQSSMALKIIALKLNTVDGKTPLGSTLIYGE
jgi:hypothetical protein